MDKKLYKSKDNRIIAGVCGGIGEYFNVDPTVIRVGAAILAMMGSFGIWAYFAAAFIMPSFPGDTDGES